MALQRFLVHYFIFPQKAGCPRSVLRGIVVKRYKNELLFVALICFTFGLLLYLETQLPFFRQFLPVGDNKLIIIMLNINLLLILLLSFLVTRALVKTYIEKKRGLWGSGLKTKLTVTLLIISIIPSFSLYILATGSFQISMDKWFSQKIEDTLDGAVQLSRFYYEDQFQRNERTAFFLAHDIGRKDLIEDEKGLARFVKKSSTEKALGYLGIHDLSGKIIHANRPFPDELQKKFMTNAWLYARGKPIQTIVPFKDGEVLVTAARIKDEAGSSLAILLIGDIIKVRGAERLNEILATSREFREARPFKKLLKYSFYIPLSLVTIMTIFFSVWVGTKMATEITTPIERMREGASIIAKGSFDINLEDKGKDEIGTLVSAFNRMARELKVAKDEIEEKRRYMEVILDNVATGIISTDKRGNILLFNKAAQNILGIQGDTWAGMTLRGVFGDSLRSHMRSFLHEARGTDGASVTKEIRLALKNDVTYARASLTILKDASRKPEGFVITFDDITHFVRAERLATWRDVARKLTHEIKNPLTPIVLSAQRLRRRLLSRFEGHEKEILDETTSVIIRSAEDIKGIVNELTKLTHVSQSKAMEDINAIVEETINLYRHLYQNITFNLEKTEIPPFRMDRDGIKRVLMNLITNSVKAIGSAEGAISMITRYESDRAIGILEVVDTGRGVPDEHKEQIFDPYFTQDNDGMGLGLAIVQSIVLEHQGRIRVEDNLPRGARFVIELPVVAT
jgi:two-component system, NtrC family, nitrogen regulation sensor histidine kinase NtrY